MNPPSILILGAGLAGLSAAETLSDAGIRAVLLEAKSEVGGRTYSQRLDGAVIERGAEFYHPDHHARVVQRMAAFDLTPEPLPKSAEVIWLCEAGETRSVGEWDSIKGAPLAHQINRDSCRFDPSLWWSEEAALFDISWQDYLDRLEGVEDNKRLLKALLHTLTGSPATQHSALGVLREIAQFGGLEEALNAHECRIKGGTHQLSRAIESRLQAQGLTEIRFGASVKSIDQAASRYQVTLEEGAMIETDALLVALPLNVATSLAWGDGLGETCPLLMARLGSHANRSRKHWFPVSQPFQDRISSDTSSIAFTEGSRQFGCVIAPSEAPLEREAGLLSLDVNHERIVSDHDWVGDPAARGAWMTPRVGQISLLHEVHQLSTNQPRLQWVGGDWSPAWAGWMEGAIQSGEDAAARLIRLFSPA